MSDSNNYDIVGKYFDMVQQEIKKLISKDPEIKPDQVDEFNAEIFNQPDQIKAEIRTYIDNAYQSNLDIKKVAKAIYDKFKVQVKNNVFNNTDKQDVPNPLLGERRHIKTFEQWTTDVSGDYVVNYGDKPQLYIKKVALLMITKFKIFENNSESVNHPELSGKHAFMIFLQIISNHDYNFINNEHFTDLYNYHLFL